MDINKIMEQVKAGERAIDEMNRQTKSFGDVMSAAVQGAPTKDQKEMEKLRVMAMKAINLAKEGKTDEANQLIKNFSDGRKN